MPDIVDLVHRYWNHEHFDASLGVFMGAEVALHETTVLLNRIGWKARPQRHTTPSAAETFHRIRLSRQPIDWAAEDRFAEWSVGYFLNDAEGRIASALDKCTMAAFCLVKRIAPKSDEAAALHIHWPERFDVIVKSHQAIGSPDTNRIADMLAGIRDPIDKFGSAKSRGRVGEFLSSLYDELTAKLEAGTSIDDLRLQNPQSEITIAVIWSLANVFKHTVGGHFSRIERGFVPELVTTRIAAEWLGELLRLMAVTSHLFPKPA